MKLNRSLVVALAVSASACSQTPPTPSSTPTMVRPPPTCPNEHSGDERGPDECALAAAALALDQPVEASIAFASDQDWYLLAASDLAVYEVATTTRLRDGPCGECPVQLDVFDAAGNMLHSGLGSLIARVRAEPLYLRVSSGLENPASPSLQYTLVLTAREKDDHPNVFDEVPITSNLNVSGHMDYLGDSDVIRVTIPAKRAFLLAAQLESDSEISIHLRLADGTTYTLERSLSFTLQETAAVEVRVECAGDTCDWFRRNSWSLEFTDLGPDEASDSFVAPTLIGEEASGVSDRNFDSDWFRVAPMREGQFYDLAFTGNVRALLYELDGTGVAEGPVLFVGQPRERRLLIVDKGQRGPWSVRFTEMGVDEVGDTVAGARPIAPDQPYRGFFEDPADRDSFVFDAEDNHFYGATAANPSVIGSFIDGAGRETKGRLPLFVRAERSGPIPLLLSLAPSPPPGGLYQLLVSDLGADESVDPLALELPADGGQLGAAFQAPIDVDAMTLQSSVGFVEVRVDATGGVAARIELLDGGIVSHAGDAGVAFSVRPDRVRRIELTASSNAPVGMRYTATGRPVSDDFDDQEPTPITIGTPAFGEIEFAGDVDLFSFQMDAFKPFRVHITPGCVFFTLVFPGGYTRGLWTGNGLSSDGAGRYLLRAQGDHCETVSYGFTVTVP